MIYIIINTDFQRCISEFYYKWLFCDLAQHAQEMWISGHRERTACGCTVMYTIQPGIARGKSSIVNDHGAENVSTGHYSFAAIINQLKWGILFVCWLLNVPATCECISGTDLLRQFYVLLHWDRSCRSNFLPHPVTVYWHLADQSQRWPYNARRLSG